ncbi:MAG: D-alanyl-D-alanine-carboxypeptidase/endopeptidase AmpH [Alphaproteobacteria bacterium]|nr:D-alanyl-D-alanine-carboxypeptidase/endopeptidase AmpH [Alphaproteobacteria bacterium]
MGKSGKRIFAAALTAFVWLVPARADSFTDIVQPAVDGMYAAGVAPGMVVAIVRGEETYLRGFGETAPGNGVVPDAHSLVRIASLSKLFTSDVLAAMVADRRVALDDTLQSHAPSGRIVPFGKGAAPIRLLNLATHTSGLPREAPEPRWDWLEKVKLKPAGVAASYSNIGFDLLADALGQASGMPYPRLLAHYTTGPLGMQDTTPAPTPEQCRRMITGGIPEKPCEDQTVMAGNGGLYSTAADMAIWMRYQMDDQDRAGAERRLIAHEIYVNRNDLTEAEGLDHAGHAEGIGLAWILLRPEDGSQPLLEKTGNIGGFMSYIALIPDKQVGIFVSLARSTDPRLAMHAAIKGVNALARDLASDDLYTAALPTRSSVDTGPAQ